jgi:hypothetical protein
VTADSIRTARLELPALTVPQHDRLLAGDLAGVGRDLDADIGADWLDDARWLLSLRRDQLHVEIGCRVAHGQRHALEAADVAELPLTRLGEQPEDLAVPPEPGRDDGRTPVLVDRRQPRHPRRREHGCDVRRRADRGRHTGAGVGR